MQHWSVALNAFVLRYLCCSPFSSPAGSRLLSVSETSSPAPQTSFLLCSSACVPDSLSRHKFYMSCVLMKHQTTRREGVRVCLLFFFFFPICLWGVCFVCNKPLFTCALCFWEMRANMRKRNCFSSLAAWPLVSLFISSLYVCDFIPLSFQFTLYFPQHI